MKDINGIEIKTGDVVEIKGAYFKSDNGLYYVRHSAGDPDWCGTDHCLTKICRNGKISTSKRATAFWPIMVTTNDRFKRFDARAWNEKHATIEIRHDIDRTEIAKHFLDKADEMDGQIEQCRYDFGDDSKVTKDAVTIRNHYRQIAKAIA